MENKIVPQQLNSSTIRWQQAMCASTCIFLFQKAALGFTVSQHLSCSCPELASRDAPLAYLHSPVVCHCYRRISFIHMFG